MSEMTEKRSSSWIPWTFVGGFGVILIANGALLYFAIQSWTGIETESAYEKGLAFNEQIESAEAQARLGWQAELLVEPAGDKRAAVTLTLLDAAAAPLERAEVTATFVRPTHSGHDVDLVLVPLGGGRYGAAAALPFAGQWDLELDILHPRGQYRMTERVVLQ